MNDSPTHAHHRYIINFENWPLRRDDLGKAWKDADEDARAEWLRNGIVPLDYTDPVAADYPDLLSIIEKRVKGTRASHSTAPWWQFERLRGEMYKAILGLPRVLVNPLVSKHLSFAFLGARTVLSKQLNVMPFGSFSSFALLQSRVHEVWARFFSATLEDRLSYAPTDCLETFPFPLGFEARGELEALGHEYYECRTALMQQYNEGLTTIYNWFHDPNRNAKR